MFVFLSSCTNTTMVTVSVIGGKNQASGARAVLSFPGELLGHSLGDPRAAFSDGLG